jgi:hypothetical protein
LLKGVVDVAEPGLFQSYVLLLLQLLVDRQGA